MVALLVPLMITSMATRNVYQLHLFIDGATFIVS
jgi:hypothetical protein